MENNTERHKHNSKNSLRPPRRVSDKDADVYAEDGCENTEQRDGGERADKLDPDEHTDEHENEKSRAVDPVRVVRVLRYGDRAEYVQHLRGHVLLRPANQSTLDKYTGHRAEYVQHLGGHVLLRPDNNTK